MRIALSPSPSPACGRRVRGSAGEGSRFFHIARAFHFDADELAADRHGFAELAAERDHFAVHRRGNFHRRLVGHHVGQYLVFGDRVAGLHVPFDQLHFGDAFADVGHFDHV